MSTMSLLTSQMTPKMSTAYSGMSALIQAATSQLGDLAQTESPEGSPPFLSNPTTPTLEGEQLYLDGTPSWRGGAATVTPVISSAEGEGPGTAKLFFPEVLMLLLANPANEDIVTFLPDGKYFAIRRLEFSEGLLQQHFQRTKFEDFLEEAMGWGYIRVNGNVNVNCNGTSNTNDGDCDGSSEGNGSISKDEIFVFRHPHFERNKPVDMSKMRRQKYERFFSGDKATTRIGIEQTANRTKSSKRQLPPSADDKDFHDNCQRLRIGGKKMSVDTDPFLLSGSSCEQPVQLRRRSSLELRSVAEAITASKLQLNNSMDTAKDDFSNQHSTILCDPDGMVFVRNGSDRTPAKLERRASTASSLVDGGVETATQNIVTDAIEALLFDEGHTRETYSRHEKELSTSSLPGVVPISKQLFSTNDIGDKGRISKDRNDQGVATMTNKSPGQKENDTTNERSQTSPSWMVGNTTGSLEDASRSNGNNVSSCSFSNNRDLKVTIPADQGESMQRSMVVSPARMEAAAALVSQSRNRTDGL